MRAGKLLAISLTIMVFLFLSSSFAPRTIEASTPPTPPPGEASIMGELAASEATASGVTGQSTVDAAAAASISYNITWAEQSKITVVEWWNAPQRAACDYAANPWPARELAAERAYVLGARQILRDVMHMGDWLAANRASTSQVRIHGAETNCPIVNGVPHLDYPPHVHIFYLSLDANGGWHHINSHHYPDNTGKITGNFVIPNLCGQSASYSLPAGQWLDVLDETCTPAWQQRYTSTGDLQLRRSPSDPIYAVRIRPLDPAAPDLAGVDVLNATTGQTLYTIQITLYDPVNFLWQATIGDSQTGQTVLEKWWGDPAAGVNLVGHTVTPLTAATPTPFKIFLPFISR